MDHIEVRALGSLVVELQIHSKGFHIDRGGSTR
jgi:hypothetical protein